MSESISQSNRRNPYTKKIQEWEKALEMIESLAFSSLSKRILSYHEFSQKRDDLAKISAGVRKAIETLSHFDDFSDPANSIPLQNLVKLSIRVKRVDAILSQTDVVANIKDKVEEALKDRRE